MNEKWKPPQEAANENFDLNLQPELDAHPELRGRQLFQEAVAKFVSIGFPKVLMEATANLILGGVPLSKFDENSPETHLHDNLRTLFMELQDEVPNELRIKNTLNAIRGLRKKLQDSHEITSVRAFPQASLDSEAKEA